MLGLDMSAISKIENNKINFKENLLSKLAEIFDIALEIMQEEYFSDKFSYEVYQNKVPETIFKLAEQKVQYIKASNAKQTNLEL